MTHDEESAGLLPQNPQNAGLPPQRSGVFVSARVAIVLGVCWVASLGFVSRTGSNPLEAQLNEVKSAASPTTLSMMKRTHLSTDSIKEGGLSPHSQITFATCLLFLHNTSACGRRSPRLSQGPLPPFAHRRVVDHAPRHRKGY